MKRNWIKSTITPLLLITLCLVITSCTQTEKVIHTAHLTAGWYPHSPSELQDAIGKYDQFATKNLSIPFSANSIKALIVPHAGYRYSGLCAASAYASLLKNGKKNTDITSVMIIAPSHYLPVNGIALPKFTHYKTPLGTIPLDTQAIEQMSKNRLFSIFDDAFTQEHSIEVQLPFLQEHIASFKIIPVIIGSMATVNMTIMAEELKNHVGPHTLVVATTDLIHYGQSYKNTPFKEAVFDMINYFNRTALEQIANQSATGFLNVVKENGLNLCGKHAIALLLKMSELGAFGQVSPSLSCYYSSPQIIGKDTSENISIKDLFAPCSDEQSSESVSYAAFVFSTTPQQGQPASMRLTNFEKLSLLASSRRILENHFSPEFGERRLNEELLLPMPSPGLQENTAIFSTLTSNNGELMGCIGTFDRNQPLMRIAPLITKSAALKDARFEPLQASQLAHTHISLSVLSDTKPVKSYRDIILEKHGIIMNKDGASATFLPEVAPENHWTLEKTLSELSLKAGLEPDAWKEGATFEVYESYKIRE